MTKLKKILLLSLSVFLCKAASAEVVDLDYMIGDHCRQQLLNASKNEGPLVVLSYVEDSPEAKAYMPIYEAVAKKHPELNFFRLKYAYNDDALSRETVAVCLRQLGSIGEEDSQRATAWLFYRILDEETGNPYLFGPLRVGPNKMTKESLEEFITLPPGHSLSKSLSFKREGLA